MLKLIGSGRHTIPPTMHGTTPLQERIIYPKTPALPRLENLNYAEETACTEAPGEKVGTKPKQEGEEHMIG